MNRFVKSGSWSFFLVTWVFLVTLFADGANLDDIFAINVVVHDDDEVTSGVLPIRSSPEGTTPLHPAKHPLPPIRVIVDQDSPSLAADTDALLIVGMTFSGEDEKVLPQTTLPAEELHIKLRTLLI